jgi:uncharacterized glyoxalase superfamily protein PhnB
MPMVRVKRRAIVYPGHIGAWGATNSELGEESMSSSAGAVALQPYLRVRNAAQAIEFYRTVFGAEEVFRLAEPSGRVGHAELRIGAFTLMLSDEYPEFGILAPQTPGGGGVYLSLQVASGMDELVERAKAAGATVVRPPEDQFYGQRSATLRDPFGHEWLLGQEIEKVSNEEVQRRFATFFTRGASCG